MMLPSLKCKHQNALHIHSPVVIDVGRPPLCLYHNRLTSADVDPSEKWR